MAHGRTRNRQHRGWRYLFLAFLLALLPSVVASNPLHDLVRIRELVLRGEYDHALELAERLARSEPGRMFRHLPDQVRAERRVALGNPAAALDLFRRVTPRGGCLVSHAPSYWNSCERMADLYGGIGDVAGQIAMLRLLAHGAGLREGTSPPDAYLGLAQAYEAVGDLARANDYYRTVVHTFDDRRRQRRSREALDRHGEAEGSADEVILHNALSEDDVLRRAGRVGLERLDDAGLAFETLFAAAAEPGMREICLSTLVDLPVIDLEGRLRDSLHHSRDAVAQGLAQKALDRLTGLTYPYLDADGAVQGTFDDTSPFAGVWGAAFLLERLEDPYESERVRLMALDALGHTADLRGLEAILPHLGNLRPAWRAHALHALRGYGGNRVEKAIVGRLEDPDPLVRLFAAADVARRQLPDATDLLAEALVREDDPLVAAALAEALAAQGDDDTAGVLADLARRLGGPAAVKAGEGLLRLGDDRGAALLESAARGTGPAARWAQELLLQAADADESTEPLTPLLDQLVPPTPLREPAPVPGPESSGPEIFAAALMGIPPPPARVPPLLESSRWSEYRGAALALANAGVRTHLNVIRRRARSVTYAADGTERVQYDEELMEALGLLQDDAALPLLREALGSRRSRAAARAAAARALGRLGDTGATSLLLGAFTDPGSPARVRRAAAWALSQIGGPDLAPILLGGLESPDADTRRWTLLLLRDTGAELGRDVTLHVATLDPDPEVRSMAALVAPAIDPTGN